MISSLFINLHIAVSENGAQFHFSGSLIDGSQHNYIGKRTGLLVAVSGI